MTEVLDKSVIEALSTETRRGIIKLLEKRPYTASELSAKLNKHVTTITEHLNLLEKSGLIKKKESNNKWIYYALSDKGERIFKPTYYSWVIVLSISFLFLMLGTQQIIAPNYFESAKTPPDFLDSMNEENTINEGTVKSIQETATKTGATTNNRKANNTETTTTQAKTTMPITPDNTRFIIGTMLIVLALVGFSYLIIKHLRK